jgi:hypothetical protein
VVVDPVVLAINLSPFGIKHQNGETSGLTSLPHQKQQMKSKGNENPRQFGTKYIDTVYVVEASSFIQIHLFPFNIPLILHRLNSNKIISLKRLNCSIFSPSTYASKLKDL